MGKIIELIFSNNNKNSLQFNIDMDDYPNAWCNIIAIDEDKIQDLGNQDLSKILTGFNNILNTDKSSFAVGRLMTEPTAYVATLLPLRTIIASLNDKDNRISLYFEDTKNNTGYIKFFEFNMKDILIYLDWFSPNNYCNEILQNYIKSNSILNYSLDKINDNIDQSHTTKEIKYIKNNWDRVKNNVKFYKDGKEVKEPW